MYLARIRITLRPSILDPQGKAVHHAIGALGVAGVHEVRMGKIVEMKLDAGSADEAKRVTGEVCKKLLANPVMEDFQFEIEAL